MKQTHKPLEEYGNTALYLHFYASASWTTLKN